MATKRLIVNGLVVTMDAARRVIEGGAVLVAGDRIAAIGDTAALREAHPGTAEIDASGMAVLPGLVDAHAHAGHTLVKTLGGGDGGRWTQAVETLYPRGATPDFWAADGALAALERLKAGVTTGLSIFGAYGSRTDDPAHAEAHAAAYRRVGVRSVLCPGVSPPPYPNRFFDWDGATHRERQVALEDQLAVCATLVDRLHDVDGAAVRIMLCAPVGYPGRHGLTPENAGLYPEAAKQVRALSRARGVGFTQDGHKGGTVRDAMAQGLLGPDALLSHCIDLDEAEIRMVAETGTKIAHNPSANMSIIGRCPAIELMEAGATVAICSDGTAPDRSFDMFRHMTQAMHYHRRHFRDARVLPPGKALEMITCDAAKALGMEAEIGSLAPGKRADITLVDLRKPHLWPGDMPLYRLVCFAVAADVDTVMVGGRVLMQGRRVLTVAEEAVMEDATREIGLALARTGLEAMTATPPGFWGATRYG
ncbi:amidohydrolase family protein [Falsiroseomonas selenitidurans]|uniref:Amidohydrolase family protein n=1 Tax=Falsiroseomonas selenitidurans TaxID=2716335 RepID=A0ABX1EB90_9PROT|nr:amidohydrolase family protein [Falsiroseomonas selenitidurans]NKC34086.1 amidohydrolase family protein [Falsiroseomonas selenitidurans]